MEYRIPTAMWLGVGLAVAGVLAALLVAPRLSRYLRLGRKP
jgi:gas vesicle protein